MPQEKKLCLARLAGEYGLKTAQGEEAAKNLGLKLRRGAAIVKPWQEKLLRPELQRMKNERQRDLQDRTYYSSVPDGPVRYESDDDHTGYLADNERPVFPNAEMHRMLNPILKKMLEDEKGSG